MIKIPSVFRIKWAGFLIIFLGICLSIHAQELKITDIEYREDKVLIHYDILDTLVGRYYTVRVYSSRDNFLNPLEHVSGEVGMELKPGPDKVIVWDAARELGDFFTGDVSLELRGRIFIPFINMDWFEDIKALRRKRKYNITWTGGRPQNILNFDLYNKDGKKITTFANVANVGHYGLALPGSVKPGKGYRFRVSDIKNKDEVVFTHRFRIKRKVPLIVSVLPGFLVAGAIMKLTGQEVNNEIPGPLTPEE